MMGMEIKYNGSMNATPSQHATMIFNVFVVMTLFNELNARKIHGERNIFHGLDKNPIFYAIMILTATLQVLIVQFGGRVFSTAPLTLTQWVFCLATGIGTLFWGQVLISITPSILSLSCWRQKAKASTLARAADEEEQADLQAHLQMGVTLSAWRWRRLHIKVCRHAKTSIRPTMDIPDYLFQPPTAACGPGIPEHHGRDRRTATRTEH